MVWKHSKTYLFIYNFNILKEESFNYKIFQLSNSKKLYWCQQGIGILKKLFERYEETILCKLIS